MNASIKANPMPDRSSSGFVVYNGSMARSRSSIPLPSSLTRICSNEMELLFDAISDNEGFARVAVSAFVAGANPTLEELADIKTAVSEAVTNSIIHGYEIIRICSGFS